MGDEYKDKVIEHLMKIYQDKSQDWILDIDEVDEDRWSDFDRDSDEEIEEDDLEDDFEGVSTILMDELTANNLDSHILLKYPKIANWWGSVLKERKKKAEALRKREEARRQKEEDKRAREVLVARLTPEERRLLGVK
jgi:hypothetical protein